MTDKINRPLSAEVAKHVEEPLAAWERELLNGSLPTVQDKTAYICGPMRGAGKRKPKPDFNYPAFNAVAKNRREATAWKINNPAENFGGDSTKTFAEYMQRDLRMVLESSHIILLPGWEKSEGATLEIRMAIALGHKFWAATLITPELDPYDSESWTFNEIDPPKVVGGIEAEARSLVWGDRNQAYGPPSHDFECTGRKWAATLSAHTGKTIDDIPPEIVSIMMADLKTSRLAGNPTHHDSMVDIIGYVLCHWRIVTNDGMR